MSCIYNPAVKSKIAILLITLILCYAPVKLFSDDSLSASKNKSGVNLVDKDSGEKPDRERDHETPSGSRLCSLVVIPYFLLFTFSLVFGAVVFVADLITGFTEHLTKEYLEYIKGKFKSIRDFFCFLGCPDC